METRYLIVDRGLNATSAGQGLKAASVIVVADASTGLFYECSRVSPDADLADGEAFIQVGKISNPKHVVCFQDTNGEIPRKAIYDAINTGQYSTQEMLNINAAYERFTKKATGTKASLLRVTANPVRKTRVDPYARPTVVAPAPSA